MNINYLGDTKKYPALFAIIDEIDKLKPRNQRCIKSLIFELSNILMKHSKIQDKGLQKYLIKLIRRDFILRVDGLNDNYNTNLCEHLKNLIVARTREVDIKLKNTDIHYQKIK